MKSGSVSDHGVVAVVADISVEADVDVDGGRGYELLDKEQGEVYVDNDGGVYDGRDS